MGSTDLDAMKEIPKQNSVCVCVKEGDSLKGIHYSISFLFCPDPLIGICMTLHARVVVYCKDDYWCKKQNLLLFSIFVLQADSRESTEAQSSKPNHPNTHIQNAFCCIRASRSSLTLTWLKAINASVLSVSRHMAVIHLLFSRSPVRCTPPSFSCQKSCRIPPCTIKIGDAAHVWV